MWGASEDKMRTLEEVMSVRTLSAVSLVVSDPVARYSGSLGMYPSR